MSDLIAAGTELLYREALFLDNQRWDDWLALFVEDCEFWLPSWKAEHELTADPRTELSLLYYSSRAGLEDRVSRVRSGRSVASTPLPRTLHTITNVLLLSHSESAMSLHSNWTVHEFRTKRRETHVQYGSYAHDLVLRDAGWRIRRKKIVMLNDFMPTMLDFYSF
ncbi:MAG: aromatic-ring-hydroxylating dioxygenase subunit beta [Lautropia sp.]